MQFSITLAIIVITSIVSFSAFNNQKITNDLIFYPPAVTAQKQWYRFFSCGLIHADFTHLLFNMLSLYLFGRFVEGSFLQIFGEVGKWYYLVMYVSALMASLLPTYAKHKNDYYYRSLGASGAVSAVVFAGLMIAPYVEVGFFIIPPIIPGFIFAPLYLLISAYLDRNGRDNINHSAHIWGAIFGLFFIIVAGKLAGYDAIRAFINGVKYYLMSKGWM
ncbi:rhomboid family intramembrane serine protease [Chitinophagaceae bacterium LB-8]|uniref:Rhomboid family intramembrane serine protease n=1 Tax=Paraflavisolibacter caeni TaxID=2982496 RepID=A0A9X3BA50_9BACT|nr:rhomboid family intramembrane serine protease [Paraflavisolibacter caeni]MCU7552186.1 rhomboid family intramembrane serine protease [Paraflavisolibacter caeni]